jgi:hypothetical protein
VLQFRLNRETLSVIAGMTFVQFYSRLFAGAIRGRQVVEFPRHLGGQLKGQVILVWDRLILLAPVLFTTYSNHRWTSAGAGLGSASVADGFF